MPKSNPYYLMQDSLHAPSSRFHAKLILRISTSVLRQPIQAGNSPLSVGLFFVHGIDALTISATSGNWAFHIQ